MTDSSQKVRIFSIAAGARAFIERSAPLNFDKARIESDAKEIDRLLSKMRELNPYRHAEWLEMHDVATELSFSLRRYGFHLPVSVSFDLSATTKDDPWGTEEDYRAEAEAERNERTRTRSAKKSSRQTTKKRAA